MITIIQDFKRLCITNQIENRAWHELNAFLCLKKPNPEGLKKHKEENPDACQAYPCFYDLYGPFYKSGFDSGDIVGGVIYGAFCGDCLFYKDAFRYQYLKNKLKRAHERKNVAARKFWGNFHLLKNKARE